MRNTISSALFPGTSTLQTRARYFLFLPWILQQAASAKPLDRERRERDLQLRLCQELQKNEGYGRGVIGGVAGAGLRRWPTSIYWGGLMAWKIWRADESPEPAIVPADYKGHVADLDWGEADGDIPPAPSAWTPLPSPPSKFPKGSTFELTQTEAEFLCERVRYSQPRTYMAHLLEDPDLEGIDEAKTPWDCPAATTVKGPVKQLLDDARILSFVHSGATALYNLMLAEANQHEEKIAGFTRELNWWTAELAARRTELLNWDRTAMWARIRGYHPGLRPATEAFVQTWFDLAVDSGAEVNRPQTRDLLVNRELVLKGRRARLSYPDARLRHGGYVAGGQMTYRWGPAKRILLDIIKALGS